MASHHPRRDDNPSVFTPETPQFFQVILQADIQDGVLGIPRRFARLYGDQLPSVVKLEVPSGETWTVELAKTDGRVVLQKGWREFAEHYSLKLGSFVVFRYEGNGHFHVLIFGNTETEIEYPITEDFPCPFTRRASAFKSRENPDFMVVMQPSYLRNNYIMGVPTDFAKKYMKMQTCELILSDSSGKTWPVKYYSKALPEHNDQLQAHIRDGWKAFVEDNDLAVGDICIFELIKQLQQPKIMMKVVIIRNVENASKSCRPSG